MEHNLLPEHIAHAGTEQPQVEHAKPVRRPLKTRPRLTPKQLKANREIAEILGIDLNAPPTPEELELRKIWE